MDIFAYILTEAWNEIINRPFEIFGFTLSFAQGFVYTTLGGILLWMVGEIFDV